MKIFINKDQGKVNFVDKNNVFVGYDTEQQCCEFASYCITSPKPIGTISEHSTDKEMDFESHGFCNPNDLENYYFDDKFFKKKRYYNLARLYDNFEEYLAIFRLINDNNQELFLYLINCHNGYYVHNFEMGSGDKILYEGCL